MDPTRYPHLPLGKPVAYRGEYDPTLLAPFPRRHQRQELNVGEPPLPFSGVDWWNSYEFSWLNSHGKPTAALATFTVPCDSSHIVESKSFKLYLNSFNETPFATPHQVTERLRRDLSDAVGATVAVALTELNAWDAHHTPHYALTTLPGECLDQLDIAVEHYHPAPQLLADAVGQRRGSETLYTHLFKSLCPVTAQPDWGSVLIHYSGRLIERPQLLAYLISYRRHSGFHEHCVEQIFMDLWRLAQPDQLVVYARFNRRGGLDINPLRHSLSVDATDDVLLAIGNRRLIRQ